MADPRQYLNNPQARQFLDLIAKAEGVKHGYNTVFGNERFGNLSAHPNVRKYFKQTDGKTNVTTAAGRYQFLKGTWDGLSRQYSLKDFSPQSQDIGAIALIMEKGALNDVLKGDYKTAVNKLGHTWASLPSSPYAQPKKSWNELGLTNHSTPSYQPQFVNLEKVGIKSKQVNTYQPEFIDIKSVGIGPVKQNQQYQPQFIDLKSVGLG